MNQREGRMPVAAVASLAVHALLFLAFIWTAQKASDGTKQMISNVDLIIPVKKMETLPQPVEQKAKQTTLDFLKLALPSIPKAAAPKTIDVPLEARKPIMPETPDKIIERKRIADAPKLEGMDLGRRGADLAKLNVASPSRRAATMEATAPKLEEVGHRRSKLAEVQGLEDAGRAGAGLQAIRSPIVDTGGTRGRNAAMQAQGAGLQEAARPSGGMSGKLAALLPEAQPMPARAMAAPSIKSPIEETKAAPRAKAEALPGKSKNVELEGPIADRKVAAYEIPQFPAWAKDLGLVEAEVRIRFWVSRDGDVLPDMRVEHTSGYGRLDRHAMESLKKWKFAPIFTEEKQWGVITFRFLLE